MCNEMPQVYHDDDTQAKKITLRSFSVTLLPFTVAVSSRGLSKVDTVREIQWRDAFFLCYDYL